MYNNIIKQITTLLDENDTDILLIAIDGPSGSGKSKLGQVLYETFCCNLFHMDDFFLTPDIRTDDRLKEIGGNVDYDRFCHEILENIVYKKDFQYNIFDCKTQSMTLSHKVFHKRLNIIEGVYSFHPTLIDYYNLKIFLDVDKPTQQERILNRSGATMLERFNSEWIPLENLYFKNLSIKNKSDIAFDTTQLY